MLCMFLLRYFTKVFTSQNNKYQTGCNLYHHEIELVAMCVTKKTQSTFLLPFNVTSWKAEGMNSDCFFPWNQHIIYLNWFSISPSPKQNKGRSSLRQQSAFLCRFSIINRMSTSQNYYYVAILEVTGDFPLFVVIPFMVKV